MALSYIISAQGELSLYFSWSQLAGSACLTRHGRSHVLHVIWTVHL